MIVNTMELFFRVSELIEDQVDSVDISINVDDEDESTLSFEVAGDYDECIGYDPIYSVDSPYSDSDFIVSPEAPAPIVHTYAEIQLTANAFHDAITLCRNQLESTSLSADERSHIASTLKTYQSHMSQLDAFLKACKLK